MLVQQYVISVCAGLTGLVVGAGYGAYRGRPMYIYSLSLGANLSAIAVVFLGVREVVVQRLNLAEVDTREETSGYISSATSGGVTGLATASVASESLCYTTHYNIAGESNVYVKHAYIKYTCLQSTYFDNFIILSYPT